jgi:hypothetical protein
MISESHTQAQVDRSQEARADAREGPGATSSRVGSWGLVTALLLWAGSPGTTLAQATEASSERPGLAVTVEGEIDAHFMAVRAVLLDVEGLGAWFPGVDEWRVLERRADSMLVYGSQDLPWPVTDRDYVVRYRWEAPSRGLFALEARSERAEAMPRREGRVRVERMLTRWELAPAEGQRSRVRYVYEGGTGLPLPRWVARIGWERRAGAVVEALRTEVARRAGAAIQRRPDLDGAGEPDRPHGDDERATRGREDES